MEIEVVALDHLYVSVRTLAASEAFYDPVMKLLGFRKGTLPIAGEPHRHYFNRVMAFTIRPARGSRAHDPYAPGLHHVCFRLAEPDAVDRVARGLRELGVNATEPRLYPGARHDPTVPMKRERRATIPLTSRVSAARASSSAAAPGGDRCGTRAPARPAPASPGRPHGLRRDHPRVPGRGSSRRT